jgi:hypothetical protein
VVQQQAEQYAKALPGKFSSFCSTSTITNNSRILCSSDLDRAVSKSFAIGSSVSGVASDDHYLGRWLVGHCMVWEFRNIRRRNKVSELLSIEAASKNRLHTFNR